MQPSQIFANDQALEHHCLLFSEAIKPLTRAKNPKTSPNGVLEYDISTTVLQFRRLQVHGRRQKIHHGLNHCRVFEYVVGLGFIDNLRSRSGAAIEIFAAIHSLFALG